MESLIGKTIDNYRILEVIGRGGMGVVFKALDTSLEKIVAVKMIDPFLARDENFVRRFKTEAKALAKLENSNIVSVYALRETEAGFFMVMEYVESKPLSHSLQENGPFNLKDILSITKQLLNAIGHAHKVGVIHRDIKPSNILLCSSGRIKVTDFGLAKVVQQKGPASTVTQARAGTLYYMSPEQVKGLKNVDTRSDLYSLGMTVYEMTAGRTPFDKTDTDFTIQRKIVDGEIPSVVKFNPSVPKKFIRIIMKCIDKEPDKRYQTADEMLEDIQNFESKISEKENKVEKALKLKSISKRNTVIISSLVFLLLLTFFYIKFIKDGESYLSIVTTPAQAEIFIDDSPIGKTPIEEYKLEKEGNIKIRIRKEGYVQLDTLLNITIGQKDSLSLTLSLIPTKQISIRTKPSGAKLFLKDRSIGQSPLTKFSVKLGEHRLRIEKAGYFNIDTNIAIHDNLEKPFEFIMTQDPGVGALIVSSSPSGAEVWLDGKKMGKTTYENKELPVKTYELVIKKDGYNDYKETIKIVKNPGNPIKRNRTLTAIKEATKGFGTLIVTSKPSGTSIYLNDTFYGTTIKEIKLESGNYKLKLKMKGYEEISDMIKIESDKSTPFRKDLIPIIKPTIMSKIEILVRPFGDIYIDGQLKKENAISKFIDSLTVGKHIIKIVHPTKPEYERPIIIDENSPKLNINFGRTLKLMITSDPSVAEIIVNEKPTGFYTPQELSLSPGIHKIQVKKEGYSSTPPNKTYNIPTEIYEEIKELEEKFHFKLKKSNK